jgi:NAD-dependent DNA ligase
MTSYTITDDQINKLKSNAKHYAENIETTELEKMLLYLSDQYFNTGKSIVSDAIYDFLLNVLKKKNPSSSVLNAVGSKTKRSILLPVLKY